MNIDLKDKTALVCGSTQGIGKAAAVMLAEMGANIVLLARNTEKLKEVQKLLNTSQNQKHHFISADFTFPPEVKLAVENYLEINPQIDILVNNTGGPQGGLVSEAKTDDFLHAFNSHLICNHLLAQAVIPGMKKSNYGRIINIISTSVKIPLKGLGVSNTIRGAVASWAKTLANELGQYNITVNNVLPGATHTQRLQHLLENKAKSTGKSVEELLREMETEIPMKRIASPEEVAAAIAFLASPAASYINGINIPVDGGRTGCL
ncbi:MAG: SDR family oxidoreductase [Bacteroidetes bacterium]|nr:SDR family oxidoreductase [Bacteroidota bacterium]MBV6461057.1 3-oxoacyl-[acyl-carrier-protein] reductase FabG [Flavobacteriales bacterium]WKZ75544.1 MAG: SDR family oxidoreductase [Vicingaceae bacterium]MCL4815111.1 SDR family oxidoreductase [Flavobacteriales bacterium]NOG94782.1 SDR family oxidoreductase [Bacteroidota bacterium]